jgi:hypothetical protein
LSQLVSVFLRFSWSYACRCRYVAHAYGAHLCVHTHTAVPGSAEEKLEARLAAVETPEDDVSKIDQAILWLFRGAPLTMEEVDKDKG